MTAFIAVPASAGYGSATAGGAGLRTLSRGAVVDNGDTSRRPNLSLLVASVSTQSSRLTASIPPDPTAVGSPRPVPH